MHETPGSHQHGHQPFFNTTGRPEFDERIRDLVRDWGHARNPELIEEMIVTALRMADDDISQGDLKLFNRSLKELRYAAKVFAPYHAVRKVAVFGSARTQPDVPEYQLAMEFSRKMVEHSYMVITGGGEGIMGAANAGAGREHSFGLNIRLPFEQRANKTVEGDAKLINFNYFFTRKLNFVKETHALACFPGGFGTMDEAFECLTLMQTGKARIIPLVMVTKPGGRYWLEMEQFLRDYLLGMGLISPEDFHLFKVTDDVDEAVRYVLNFYSNYQSSRWVGHRLVFRLLHALTPTAIERMEKEFADLLHGEPIIQSGPLPVEENEPLLAHLPRLVLVPNRRNFGRLRLLIDAVNDAEKASPTH